MTVRIAVYLPNDIVDISAVIRLEWSQAKASKERFEEEVKLVRAESSRVERTFLYLGNQWRSLGAAFDEEIGEETMKPAVRALCYR